jgi:di/tricarboxylate transporter
VDPLIRNRQQALQAAETYSPAEQQFNRGRKAMDLLVAPLLGATLGAGVCFMLPISTSTDAFAHSSGHVPIGTLIKYAVSLSILSCAVIIAMVTLVGSVLF